MQHAEASEAMIEIYNRSKSIYMTISDNGKGFDIDGIFSKSVSGNGNGLVNIRYRAEILDGQCNIESSKGNGTEIHIEIPMRQS